MNYSLQHKKIRKDEEEENIPYFIESFPPSLASKR